MKAADYVRLVALAAIWGGVFIFMRVSAPVLGPGIAAAVAFCSPASHVENGLRGVLSLGDIIWFGSVIGGAGLGCVVALDESRR